MNGVLLSLRHTLVARGNKIQCSSMHDACASVTKATNFAGRAQQDRGMRLPASMPSGMLTECRIARVWNLVRATQMPVNHSSHRVRRTTPIRKTCQMSDARSGSPRSVHLLVTVWNDSPFLWLHAKQVCPEIEHTGHRSYRKADSRALCRRDAKVT